MFTILELSNELEYARGIKEEEDFIVIIVHKRKGGGDMGRKKEN